MNIPDDSWCATVAHQTIRGINQSKLVVSMLYSVIVTGKYIFFMRYLIQWYYVEYQNDTFCSIL